MIVSDHGMKPVGRFGDHTSYGFWSFNKDMKLGKSRITDFFEIMTKMKNRIKGKMTT